MKNFCRGVSACVMAWASLSATANAQDATQLQDVISILSTASPTIIAQRAAVDVQVGRLDEARSARMPVVEATGAVERRKITFSGNTVNDLNFWAKSLGAETRVPIFRGFRTVNTVKVRESEVQGGKDTLRGDSASVYFDGVAIFMDVLRDRDILGFNRRQVELIRSQLQATQSRVARGEGTRTDEQQAMARLAVAQSGLAVAEETLSTAESAYQRLIGTAPGTLAPPQYPTGMPDSLEQAKAITLAENPDIAAARSTELAARHAVAVARGQLLPNIDGVAGVEFLSGGVPNTFSGKLTEDRTAFYGGVQARVPIWQGGAEYAGIRRSKALLAQRSAEREIAERTALDEVMRAWGQWESAKAIIESARAAVAANEAAAEGVRRESIGGNRTVLDVLDAQSELLDARVGLARAERNEYVARVAVLGAVGRLSPSSFGVAARQ